MMNEKDAIALTAMAIEDTETAKNGKASVDEETFDAMMTAIDSKLSTLNKSITNLNEKFSSIDKRVYHLEYADHCDRSNSAVSIMELRKELNSLIHKVDQMESALNMSKKYRKRHDKVSTKD